MATEAEKSLLSREEEYQADYLGGQTVSLVFMRRNPMFKSSPANATKMGELIKAANLPWAVESLEQILSEHPEEFELSVEPIQPHPVPVEEKPLPPWGVLNKATINAIDREQYKKWMKNPQFQKDVNAAIQRGE